MTKLEMKRNGHSIEKELFFFLQQHVFFLILNGILLSHHISSPFLPPFEKESGLSFVLRNDSGGAGLFICVLGRGWGFGWRDWKLNLRGHLNVRKTSRRGGHLDVEYPILDLHIV